MALARSQELSEKDDDAWAAVDDNYYDHFFGEVVIRVETHTGVRQDLVWHTATKGFGGQTQLVSKLSELDCSPVTEEFWRQLVAKHSGRLEKAGLLPAKPDCRSAEYQNKPPAQTERRRTNRNGKTPKQVYTEIQKMISANQPYPVSVEKLAQIPGCSVGTVTNAFKSDSSGVLQDWRHKKSVADKSHAAADITVQPEHVIPDDEIPLILVKMEAALPTESEKQGLRAAIEPWSIEQRRDLCIAWQQSYDFD